MKDCIFCKIIKKEVETEIIFENENVIAFNDANPLAPIHVLIIPKKHIKTINDLDESDKSLIGELFLIAKNIAKEKGVAEKGYKLNINVGRDGGQTVDHIHLHLISGRN